MPRCRAGTQPTGRRSLAKRSAQRMRDDGAWPSMLLCDELDQPAGTRARAAAARLDQGHRGDHHVGRPRLGRAPPGSRDCASRRSSHASVERHEELERHHLPHRSGPGRASPRARWPSPRGWPDARLDRVAGGRAGRGSPTVAGRRQSPASRASAWSRPGAARVSRTLVTTIATRAGMAVGNRIIWLSVDD